MSKIVFTALSLLISIVSFGQDYVVTLRSDTIAGNVKLLSYDLLDRVQVTKDKKKTTYTALQVRRVVVNSEQYSPVKFENGVRLMKVVRTGFLSMYAHRTQGQSGYDTRVLQKMGTNPIEVPNIGFKKFLGDLVSDCPVVSDKLKSNGYDRNNVDSMVDEYNACIADVNRNRISAATVQTATPASDLVEQMKSKVNASDITNKSEVNDLLTSINDKLKKNETVPAYMKEGLKGYLGGREDLKADMEQLFTLIDK